MVYDDYENFQNTQNIDEIKELIDSKDNEIKELIDSKDNEIKELIDSKDNEIGILNIPISIRNIIAETLYFRNIDGDCDNDNFYEYADTYSYLNVEKCLDNWKLNSKFSILSLRIKNSNNDNNITLRVFKRKINNKKKAILIIYEGNPIFIYKINNNYSEFYICNRVEIYKIQYIMEHFKILYIFNNLIENYPSIKYHTGKYYEKINTNIYNGYVNIDENIA
jgi:hypothetical protein